MIYTLIFIAIVTFVGYAFYKINAKKIKKVPNHWHAILVKEVLFYKNLSTKNQAIFRKRMLPFFK